MTLSLAIFGLNNLSGTGFTRQSRKIPAIAYTNSTCENFSPGHFRIPSDQAIKDPLYGAIRVSCVEVVSILLNEHTAVYLVLCQSALVVS